MEMRSLHPEICLKPYLTKSQSLPSDGDGEKDQDRKMCCAVPLNQEEATAWAESTLILDFAEEAEPVRSKNAIGLAREHVANPRKDHVYPVSLRFSKVSRKDGMIGETQYVFCVDHTCTDGVGVYLIAGKYFALLADGLCNPVRKELEWVKCFNNLPVPWVAVMNQKQNTTGTDFERNTNAVQEKILQSTVSARTCFHSSIINTQTDGWVFRRIDGA